MSLVTGGWGLLYAMYRGYYGLGGTAGWMNLGRSPARRWTGTALAAIAVLTAIVDRNDHGCCAAAVFGSLLWQASSDGPLGCRPPRSGPGGKLKLVIADPTSQPVYRTTR